MAIKIIFYFISLIAKLPEKVLYTFSDFVYIIMFYGVGYRKKIVYTNVRNSFPEKSEKEIKKIVKQFYRNFCDSFIETLETISLPAEEIAQKVILKSGGEYLDEAKENKKDVALLMGHVFNWEWIVGLIYLVPQKNIYGVYKKIKNKFLNQKMEEIRFKFGGKGLEAKKVMDFILTEPITGENLYALVSDQSPKKNRIKYSITFLNQETPIFSGFDILVRKRKLAPIVAMPKKVGRGRYEMHLIKIEPKNEEFKTYEVAEKFFAILEESIKEDPASWLWTHKRWKYKKGEDY